VPADTVALPELSAAASSTATGLEAATLEAATLEAAAPFETAAALETAAKIERTTRAEHAPHTTRRTRTTARAGVSTSGASAAAARPTSTIPASPAASESPRSAARRARTTAIEVASVTPAVVVPAEVARPVAPEPVIELRQVVTTAPIVLPEPAALPATPSLAAVPVVEAARRTRLRPAVSEPVATTAPAPAEPVATAEPLITAATPRAAQVPPHAEQPAASREPARDQPRSAPKAEPAVDEFEAAARLFSFTGETPVQAPAEAPEADEEDATSHKAPRRKRNSGARRVATASFSVGVMGIVGLLAVGMTTPAEAVAAATGTPANPSISVAGTDVQGGDSDGFQTYVAPAHAQTASLDDRAIDYSSITASQAGASSGVKNVSSAFFTNDPNSAIQWPFAVGCTISWGFGWRPGEFHEGVDFTPGEGAHVQAIADGVVRISTDSGGGYGVTIVIDHIIDGKLVSSRYGHMEYGSRQVQVGDHVHVGQYIGRTGNTGRSYGAHTHLEILLNGVTPIDPLPWLRAHVT
jgi:murein DD-endopeptidase MepM/ murein hydrolase activator NlpD